MTYVLWATSGAVRLYRNEAPVHYVIVHGAALRPWNSPVRTGRKTRPLPPPGGGRWKRRRSK